MASRAARGRSSRPNVNRIFFFIAEAFRALRRSAAPSLAAIVTVVLTTLLLGVFVPVIKASSTTNENVRSQLALRVFLKADATKKQGLNVQKKIDKIPHVERTQYVSKGAGLKVLREEVGKGPLSKGLSQLKHNPLPPVDQRLSGRPRQPGVDPGRDRADRAPTASRSRSARRSTSSTTPSSSPTRSARSPTRSRSSSR